MGKFSKLNRGYKFDVELDGMSFVKLKDLFDGDSNKVYPIQAAIIFNTQYGKSPVLVSEDKLINLPGRYLADLESILADDELVDLIKQRKSGITIYEYQDTKHNNTTCYGINWVDIK